MFAKAEESSGGQAFISHLQSYTSPCTSTSSCTTLPTPLQHPLSLLHITKRSTTQEIC
ncbi:hypothetical protein M407DRAFT_116053 [Tulasnella calospora MUT 4182]|uniref:Uncharacterized protein n=1 Tax=Tulasnella calospora MUT 4182 TaxID=1051891 RepID=A0A0C3QDF0_9AGAM|nr:hypothetical protein M407DRAFT_116053 [Tulasnella calospora MUT 4182]